MDMNSRRVLSAGCADFADYIQLSGVGADRLRVGVDQDLSFARQVQRTG